MAISPEEGAQRLYKLLYGDKPTAPAPASVLDIREPVTGSKKVPPLPYRFPLIGIGPGGSNERGKVELPVHDEGARSDSMDQNINNRGRTDRYGKPIRECAGCHEIKAIIGRGLCVKCYWRQPDVKKRRKEHLAAERERERETGAAPKKPQRRKCRECGRIKPHLKRGLCGACYYQVRMSEV